MSRRGVCPPLRIVYDHRGGPSVRQRHEGHFQRAFRREVHLDKHGPVLELHSVARADGITEVRQQVLHIGDLRGEELVVEISRAAPEERAGRGECLPYVSFVMTSDPAARWRDAARTTAMVSGSDGMLVFIFFQS